MDAWSPLDAVRAWKGFDCWRGRWPGAGDRPRVFAFGSCRVHDPLAAVHGLGTVDPLARHLRAPWPIFVHDIRETLQLARLLAGEAVLLDDVAPFVFRGGWRPPPPPAAAVEVAEQALRRAGRFTPTHRRLLREIALVTVSAAEFTDGLAELHRRFAVPILVVPHVAVRLPDGSLLAERVAHIDKGDRGRTTGGPAGPLLLSLLV